MDCRMLLGAVFIFCTAMLPTMTAVETNCTVRRKRTLGELLCQFSADINREKHNFLIHRYDLNDTNLRPELVLDCQWLVGQDLHCDVKSGYEFDKKVWNMLIVDIPTISTRHNGKYICQVIGNGETKDNPCFYAHKDVTEEVGSTSTTPALVNASCPNDKDKDNQLDWNNIIMALVIGGVILFIVIVVSAMLAYIFRNGRQYNAPMYGVPQNRDCRVYPGEFVWGDLPNLSSQQSGAYQVADFEHVYSLRVPEVSNRHPFMQGAYEPEQETTRSIADADFIFDKEDEAEEAGGLPLLPEKENAHSKGHQADDLSSEDSVYTEAIEY